MSSPTTLTIEPMTEANVAALEALFSSAGCHCYCRYFHFSGTKNEWLERLAFRPEDNARELREVAARSAGPQGLVARDHVTGDVRGWAKLTRLAEVPKLRNQGAYRPLDLGDEGSTLVVGCLLVDPAHRKHGVAEALVDGAVAYARTRGAARLLGLPRRSELPLYDEEAFAGPERIYARAGFRVLHDSPAYPVYAIDFGAPASVAP